jgi:hypothetical protein
MGSRCPIHRVKPSRKEAGSDAVPAAHLPNWKLRQAFRSKHGSRPRASDVEVQNSALAPRSGPERSWSCGRVKIQVPARSSFGQGERGLWFVTRMTSQDSNEWGKDWWVERGSCDARAMSVVGHSLRRGGWAAGGVVMITFFSDSPGRISLKNKNGSRMWNGYYFHWLALGIVLDCWRP